MPLQFFRMMLPNDERRERVPCPREHGPNMDRRLLTLVWLRYGRLLYIKASRAKVLCPLFLDRIMYNTASEESEDDRRDIISTSAVHTLNKSPR
jgi:hypothetical protein